VEMLDSSESEGAEAALEEPHERTERKKNLALGRPIRKRLVQVREQRQPAP